MRVLVVDNYDSFVFNLVQYLGQLGVVAEVWRNDDDRLGTDEQIAAVADDFDAVLLSPGPGTPERAGASIPLVQACAAAATPRAAGNALWEPHATALDLTAHALRMSHLTGRLLRFERQRITQTRMDTLTGGGKR